MKFILHYIVKTPVKDLHFDTLSTWPLTAENIAHVRGGLALDAGSKIGKPIDSDDIVIANIMPIPDAIAVKQIGGA